MRRSANARVSRSSAFPVPLNSSKMMSSILLSVSTRAVAITVRDPPPSLGGTARAAPNSPFGLASALAARMLEDHVGGGNMPFVRQVEARRDHLAPTPVDHLAHFFGPFVHEQNEEGRLRMILRHRLGDRLEHHGLAGLGRRDDERALAEAERANEIHDALCLGRAWTRCLGRLERERTVRMDRAQIREIGPAIQLAGRLAIHCRHAAIVEHNQVAAAEPGEADLRIALRRQVTVGGEAERAAFGRGIEPAGDGSHGCYGGYISARCAKIISVISALSPTSTTANLRLPTDLSSSPGRSTSDSCASRCSTRWIWNASVALRSS